MDLIEKLLNKKFKRIFLSLFSNGSLEKILKYDMLDANIENITF
jgi:hypothetical protein